MQESKMGGQEYLYISKNIFLYELYIDIIYSMDVNEFFETPF